MARIDVADTIKETDELLTAKEKILAEIAENRTLLRGQVTKGTVTAEQKKWIEETFPPQSTKTPEERVEAAAQRLREVQEKAEKAAQDGKGSGSRSRAKAAA